LTATADRAPKDDNDNDDERLKGRSVRVGDALWLKAQEAAQWRGEQNLSAVIRRCLVTYVRETDRRKRNGGR
jgi:hypothetical protein